MGLSRRCFVFCVTFSLQDERKTASGRKGDWTCFCFSEWEERKKSRAGERLGFVILQDGHIDFRFYLLVFLISLCEHAIITAAGQRLRRRQGRRNAAGAHVQSNFMSCPPRPLARSFLFACGMCEKRSYFSLLLACRNNQTNSAGSFYGFPSLLFFVVHSMAFFFTAVRGNLCCNVWTGVHGAFDRPPSQVRIGHPNFHSPLQSAMWPSSGCRSRSRSWMCQCHRSRRKLWRLLQVRSSATLVQAVQATARVDVHIY